MLPKEHDPDTQVRYPDLLHKDGKEGFERRLDLAQPLSDYFFDHLSENLQMDSIEGRAALFQKANPLIGKLPAGVFREMMQARLGKMTGHGTVPSNRNKSYRPNPMLQKAGTERAKPSNLRVILGLLIQNPEFFSLINADARSELERDDKAGDLAGKLFSILKERPEIRCAGFVEHFRGEAEYGLVLKLSVLEIPLSASDARTEFLETVNKFMSQMEDQYRSERLEWLNKKVERLGFSGLDQAELDEYRRLMSKK
jgi:DNA primase